MNPSLFAFLTYPVEEGRREMGTGYIVQADRLLTAWHVVKNATQDIEVWFPDLDNARWRTRVSLGSAGHRAKHVPLWHDEELDVAVLQLTSPLPKPSNGWPRLFGLSGTTWQTYAFPRHARVPSGSLNVDLTALSGTCQEPSGKFRDLLVAGPPDKGELLKGASGAPVFSSLGNLFGVILRLRRGHEDSGNQISVVSLESLLEHQGFRECVRWQRGEDDEYVTRTVARAASWFEKNREIADAMRRAAGVTGMGGADLADHLLALNVVDLVECVADAQTLLTDGSKRERILEIMNLLLPLTWGEQQVDSLRAAEVTADDWCRLEFATDAVAEVVKARAERRPSGFELHAGERQVRGSTALHVSPGSALLQEGGSVQGCVDSLRGDLAGRVGCGGMGLQPDEEIEFINRDLRLPRRSRRATTYMVFTRDASRAEEYLRLIRKTFPDLGVIVLIGPLQDHDAIQNVLTDIHRQGR